MGLLKQPITVINAPSNLGLKPPAPGREPGTRRAPEVLCDAGILKQLAVQEFNTVPAPPYHNAIDPDTGIRNAAAIGQYSRQLAYVIRKALEKDNFPLVLGGDCSILLGSMLALRQRGTYGLIFIDGHTDFQTALTSTTGGAAGMDLALACGLGPRSLTDMEGLKPLIRDQNVIALGFRDMDNPDNYYTPEIFDTQMTLYSLKRLREIGIERTASEAITHLRQHQIDGFWIHVDVDVLNSDLMPAVDSPMADGLSGEELSRLLHVLLASEKSVGLELTIFDPDLDPGGDLAKKLVDIIVHGFTKLAH